MKQDYLKLTRFNGLEEFEIIEAEIYFSYEAAHLTLDFQTGPCISTPLEDTNENGGLSGSFWIYDLEISSLKELAGQSFFIKDGYKNEEYDTCSLFYYWEHMPITNNKIEFLTYENEVLLVKASANTVDVNWHDGSKPESKIELLAEFYCPMNYADDSTALF